MGGIGEYWFFVFAAGLLLLRYSRKAKLEPGQEVVVTKATRLLRSIPLIRWMYRRPEDEYIDSTGRALAQIEQRAAEEDQRLTAVGVALPRRLTKAEIVVDQGVTYSAFRVRYPRFEIPSHVYIPVDQRDPKQPGCGLLIIADDATCKQANQTLHAVGLHEIVRKTPGLWLSRNPYRFYQDCNSSNDMDFSGITYVLSERDQGSGDVLARATAPSVPDLFRTFSFRARLLSHLLAGTHTAFVAGGRRCADAYEYTAASTPSMFPPDLASDDRPAVFKVIPAEGKSAPFEQYLESLRSLSGTVGFHVVAEGKQFSFRLSCPVVDKARFASQLRATFPQFIVMEEETAIPAGEYHVLEAYPASSFGTFRLAKEVPYDPLGFLFRELERQEKTDRSYVSVEFAALPERFSDQIVHELAPFEDACAIAEVRRKLSEFEHKFPAWQVRIRIASTKASVVHALRSMWLSQIESTTRRMQVTECAPSERVGLWGVYSRSELATVIHFPGPDVTSEGIETVNMDKQAPPQQYLTLPGITLGLYVRGSRTSEVHFPDQFRDRHLYIIGKSRTGKSTLSFNLVRQDIDAGRGVAVIDPHGDLVKELLTYIPAHRVNDVIYFDAAEKDQPIGLSVMNAETEDEVELLANDLVVTFRRLSSRWGDQMENILRHCFHTLLRVPGSTFLDVADLLQKSDFRARILSRINSHVLQEFWELQFPNLKDSLQPILARMSKFMLSATLTGILGQRKSRLSFDEVLKNNNVLLVNLGNIGEDASTLLGSMIVSQIQLAVMRRSSVPKHQRQWFFLYVDEFQNFTNSAFEKILSEAGKFKLGLTLAHQYISQVDDDTRNAILGNVGTMVMFSSGQQDANYLRNELGSYKPSDLTDISSNDYQALCRPATRSSDTFVLKTIAPPPRPAQSYTDEIVKLTRDRYGRRGDQNQAEPHADVPDVQPPATGIAAPPNPVPRPNVVTKAAARPSMTSTPTEREGATKDPAASYGEYAFGRGGQQHKYLQELIKKSGEEKGYRATIERPVLDGAGSVDVALESDARRIACEISVTSTVDNELKSMQKCLAAGFDIVVLVTTNKKTLKQARERIEADIGEADRTRVQCMLPEDFIVLLEQLAAHDTPTEQTIHGYKVKVNYGRLSGPEQDARKKALAKTIAESMKRLKSDGE